MISNFKHMTYKKIIITIITLVFYYPGFSQPTKNYLTFHIGLQQSNTFTKPFYSFIGDEGGVIYEQLGATFFDFNILYQKQIFKSRFNELLGIGLNQKGYIEKGRDFNYNYSLKIRKTYVPLFLGMNNNFVDKKKYTLSIGQILMPEIVIMGGELYKKVALSTRTTFTISFKSTKQRTLNVSSFFQTSLSKYDKVNFYKISSVYWPYSYGINIGVSLNK